MGGGGRGGGGGEKRVGGGGGWRGRGGEGREGGKNIERRNRKTAGNRGGRHSVYSEVKRPRHQKRTLRDRMEGEIISSEVEDKKKRNVCVFGGGWI